MPQGRDVRTSGTGDSLGRTYRLTQIDDRNTGFGVTFDLEGRPVTITGAPRPVAEEQMDYAHYLVRNFLESGQ